MSRQTYAALLALLAVVIFFALNILAGSLFRQSRLDLTETGLFTLSRGTASLLQKVEEPITLRFYYSERAATDNFTIANYAQRVRDLLEEFAARSRGKVKLEVIKPEAFSPEEDQAAAAGLVGAPNAAGETVYFGLEGTNLADGREVIPYFSADREALLEYDLAVLVDRLNRLEKPTLGLLTTLPLSLGPGGALAAARGQGAPSLIYEQLQSTFTIEELDIGVDRIPETIGVLMVVQPTNLPPQTLYAIDQFVLRGGRLLAFIDPMSELAIEAQRGDFSTPVSSTLEPLLSAWGVSMSQSELVGDRLLAQRVALGGGAEQHIVDFVAWLGVTRSEMNGTDPITAEIDLLNLGGVGFLVPREGRTTTVTPLISSTDQAMLIPVDDVRYAPDPEDLLRRFAPTNERYMLAARIVGPASSAFPEGAPAVPPPESAPGEPAPPPAPLPAHLREAAGPISVILLADTDIFDDRFWVQIQQVLGQRVGVPTADNANFVLNAVDNLMGSEALIGLRGRQVAERRFEVVENLRREAELRYLKEEEALRQKLEETERRLRALETQGAPEGAAAAIAITPEQRAEILRFRQEIADTRLALRAVERNLRKEIDDLGGLLRALNIALMPLLVAGAAVGLVIAHRQRRRRRLAGGGA